MQRMFTTTVLSTLTSSAKKLKVIMESWGKSRRKKKKLSFQKTSGRKETVKIIAPSSKEKVTPQKTRSTISTINNNKYLTSAFAEDFPFKIVPHSYLIVSSCN